MLTRDAFNKTGAGFARRLFVAATGFAIVMGSVAALPGCGQKGALVLAKPAPTAAAASSAKPAQ